MLEVVEGIVEVGSSSGRRDALDVAENEGENTTHIGNLERILRVKPIDSRQYGRIQSFCEVENNGEGGVSVQILSAWYCCQYVV